MVGQNPIMMALQQNQPQQPTNTPIIPTNGANQMQEAVMRAQQMMNAYQMAQNPTGYIQQNLQNNPAFQRAVQRINQFKDPHQAFMTRCQELGVDPNEFLRQYKGGM